MTRTPIETFQGTVGLNHPDYEKFYRCREMMTYQFFDAVREAERRSDRKGADTALQKDLDEILYHCIAPIVLRYHEHQWSWAIHAHIADKVDIYSDDSIAETPPPSHENGHRTSFWAWVKKGIAMTAGSIISMYKFTNLNANPTNFPASKSALGASFSGSDPGPRRRRDFQELPPTRRSIT